LLRLETEIELVAYISVGKHIGIGTTLVIGSINFCVYRPFLN
jgi:UPF0716 family protein affecting phage T7 exclusion